MNLIAATNVDLDVILLVVAILVLLVVGLLVIMFLLKLNKAMGQVNKILVNKRKDIERTVGNLPELTENISGAAGKIKDVATSVEKITGKVNSVVDSVPAGNAGNIFLKIPVIIESAKRAYEYVSQYFSKKKATDDDDIDVEDFSFKGEDF